MKITIVKCKNGIFEVYGEYDNDEPWFSELCPEHVMNRLNKYGEDFEVKFIDEEEFKKQ